MGYLRIWKNIERFLEWFQAGDTHVFMTSSTSLTIVCSLPIRLPAMIDHWSDTPDQPISLSPPPPPPVRICPQTRGKHQRKPLLGHYWNFRWSKAKGRGGGVHCTQRHVHFMSGVEINCQTLINLCSQKIQDISEHAPGGGSRIWLDSLDSDSTPELNDIDDYWEAR